MMPFTVVHSAQVSRAWCVGWITSHAQYPTKKAAKMSFQTIAIGVRQPLAGSTAHVPVECQVGLSAQRQK
jgi:hypothetical protein